MILVPTARDDGRSRSPSRLHAVSFACSMLPRTNFESLRILMSLLGSAAWRHCESESVNGYGRIELTPDSANRYAQGVGTTCRWSVRYPHIDLNDAREEPRSRAGVKNPYRLAGKTIFTEVPPAKKSRPASTGSASHAIRYDAIQGSRNRLTRTREVRHDISAARHGVLWTIHAHLAVDGVDVQNCRWTEAAAIGGEQARGTHVNVDGDGWRFRR